MRGIARKPQAPPPPIITDPFAVIPVQPDTVERKQDSQGNIHLRLSVQPKGMVKKVADWLGYDYTKKIQLDEYGTAYYSQVDGQTTLDTIINHMTDKLGTSRDDTEGMVVLYTKKLMTMNMLALIVPENARRNP